MLKVEMKLSRFQDRTARRWSVPTCPKAEMLNSETGRRVAGPVAPFSTGQHYPRKNTCKAALNSSYFLWSLTAKMKPGNPFSWRDIPSKFAACLRDERGTAMTEYLIVSGIMIPLAAYLFHPDNGFYQNMRFQYDLTADVLQYFGP